MMTSVVFWGFFLLFSGMTSARNETNAIETSSCSPDMCDLLRDFGAMMEKVKTMERRLEDSETKIQDSEARLRDSEARLRDSETRLQDSETRLQDSENEILELKNKAGTRVIFSAAIGQGDHHVGPFNTDTTLIYRRVIENMGNAYNKATGIFTAPVSGVYYFNIFYHAGRDHGVHLSIYKNSQLMVIMSEHKSSPDSNDTGGSAVCLQLQPGDQVYVRLGAKTYVWASDYHTTFSGFLVSQM